MANEFIARNGIVSKSNLIVSGSLTALSTITAQTLVVQTITSSISSITGSTNFGSIAANTHTFTGSMSVSGSGTFVSSLSGTSATFGGLLTINVPTDNTTVGIFHAGGGTANRGLKISTFANVNDNAGVRLDAQTTAGGATLVLATAGTDRLTIASTGAATFTGNVTQNINDGTIGLYKADGTTPKAFLGNPDGSNTDEGYLELYKTSVSKVKIRANGNSYFNGGNVGIGTSPSSSFILDVNSTKASGASGIRLSTLSTSAGPILVLNYSPGTLTNWGIGSSQAISNALEFVSSATGGDPSTAGTTRMLITNGGAVYINTTSALPGSGTLLHVDSPAAGPTFKNAASGQQSLMLWNAVSSGDNLLLEFNVNTSIAGKGSIDYNRASNVIRYNTTSDANLKNIIGDSDKQKSIDILNTTKIKEYSWKEDESNKVQIGVIAQELYETFKGAVSVGSDESLLGTEDYKSWKVDKTAFTFHLIAGWQNHEQLIQEQQAQIQELTARVQELENK